MNSAPADPAAVTVSPTTERTLTPARPSLRVSLRAPGPVQLHPEITGRIEAELGEVNPSLQAAIAAVVQHEVDLSEGSDEPTDPGEGAPQSSSPRPYANLDYEERVCRLLEDLVEHTRVIRVQVTAEEHRRKTQATAELLASPEPPVEPGVAGAFTRCAEAWLPVPSQVRQLAVKVAVVWTTAGGSLAAGFSSMLLAMELLERLLRAWVTLP